MSEETTTYQLIVQQHPAAGPALDPLLQSLQGNFGLDAYTARQRLTGPGLVLFGKGPLENTRKIAALLQKFGFACWLVERRRPDFAPDLLRSLEIHAHHIDFLCQAGPVRLARDSAVVAVLADLSGALVDKHVKRLLAQNSYRGMGGLEVLSRNEVLRAIYQGHPVFDFYLLDASGEVQQAVRVLPGRFSIDGLGSRASLSTIQNLEAVVSLVEECAESCRVFYDFGLSQIPTCEVKRLDQVPAALVENLDSLTRYGWLVARLKGSGLPVAPPAVPGAAMAAGAAAAVVGQPELGAITAQDGTVPEKPGLGEVAQEIDAAIEGANDASAHQAAPPPVRKQLPPPPDRPPTSWGWGKSLKTVGGILGGITLTVGSNGDELFRLIAKYGMTAGVVPAIAAVVLIWSGFYFIRLKRRVENTPTSKIRSLAMGMVEVHGQARRSYALVAPMTQSACAWYRLRKYRKDNKDNWRLVKEVNSDHVPFRVDDGTGQVTVAPDGASIKAKVRQTGYPGQSALTFTAFGGHYDDDEKWVEDLIYEGTSLYVLGYAQPLREEKPSLRERTLARLRQLKLDARAMRRYDTDGDGKVDEAEWAVARQDMEQAALKEHLAAGGGRKRQEEHAVIARPPQRSLPFIIAETASEAHLTRKYGWINLPLLLAGGGATVLAIYKCLQYLNF